MRRVLAQIVVIVNARARANEHRSVPLGSDWLAAQIGEDPGAVRRAIRSLVKAGTLVADGELPWPRTPCFRVAVVFPCPRCMGLADEHGRPIVDEPAPAEVDDFPDRYLAFCEDEEPVLLEATS